MPGQEATVGIVSSGYFNNPSASASATEAQGWFHTGDLAKYDEEWYSYIVDHKKEAEHQIRLETINMQESGLVSCQGETSIRWVQI